MYIDKKLIFEEIFNMKKFIFSLILTGILALSGCTISSNNTNTSNTLNTSNTSNIIENSIIESSIVNDA